MTLHYLYVQFFVLNTWILSILTLHLETKSFKIDTFGTEIRSTQKYRSARLLMLCNVYVTTRISYLYSEFEFSITRCLYCDFNTLNICGLWKQIFFYIFLIYEKTEVFDRRHFREIWIDSVCYCYCIYVPCTTLWIYFCINACVMWVINNKQSQTNALNI